jgi:hypothetical protein
MYQSEAPPLKTIATDLPSQDLDEELNSTIHPRPPWETLPTMYDLPSENPVKKQNGKSNEQNGNDWLRNKQKL